MVMYCDIMISAQQLNRYGEFSIPTYISGDTEKIYGMIDELGLQDMLNHYQTDVYLHRRMDIGSVPVTSSDELKVFITFIRNHQIESLFFG